MATESYQTQLERVQGAIAAIESGSQSYSVAGRTFTKGDLKTLYERETWLRGQVAKADRGGIRISRAVPL
ncbi:MAG: hypothetical protein ACSLFE_03805 [Gemmatimonadaceae bacterium]